MDLSRFSEQLRRSGDPIAHTIRYLLSQLEGAKSALVVVIGFDADGNPVVTSMPALATPVQSYRSASHEFRRRLFHRALQESENNVRKAARLLDLPISTFRYQAEKLGLIRSGRRRRGRRSDARPLHGES